MNYVEFFRATVAVLGRKALDVAASFVRRVSSQRFELKRQLALAVLALSDLIVTPFEEGDVFQ